MPEHGDPAGVMPQELCARLVTRVVLERDQSVACERVGRALHALPRQPEDPRDLRHRRRPVLDHAQHLPARLRLPGRLRHRVPGRDQQAVQPQDLDDEIAERVPGGSALQLMRPPI